MEFKGTKGKWFIDEYKWIVTDDKYEYGDIICAPPEEWKLSIIKWNANALLISKAPEMLEKHVEEIEILESVLKQLDELGGFMAYDLKELIKSKKQLIKEATEL